MSWFGINFMSVNGTQYHIELVFQIITAYSQLLVQFLLGATFAVDHVCIISGRRTIYIEQKATHFVLAIHI